MKSRPYRRAVTALLALATAVTVGGVAVPSAQAEDTRPPFYEPPATLPANNGDVIRSEPSDYYLDPLKAIKVDAHVNRVMYRSTDGNGEPVAVTGTVITPKTGWSGKGDRPVIGYAPGTQGIGDPCAPSRQLANGTEYEGLFVKGLLARGYAVAMTDYEGLGTPGVHTYVNRAVSGNAVIDAVRAAQRLPEAGLPDAGPVALTGYSQGGGATAAAAELAPEYAPELDLKGVSAGAPPADLAKVAENLDGSLYVGFLGYAVAGLAAGYDLDLGPYLNDKGERFMADAEKACTAEAVLKFPFIKSKTLTEDGRPLTDYLDEEPFQRMVNEQRIGERAPNVPTLVTHSRLDDVIPYEVGRDMVAGWCERGAPDVEFATLATPTHVGGAVASFPRVFLWLEDRFAGKEPSSDCGSLS
ncbi:lipase [Streptomyces armeniacus]|uniref:Lipase n=1 Tax=Streptomyces armeniacus TaxID=83291 RepID=A0A345XMF7_9ACTN|nr:lipase family protein [Streptomyces armeniacus]AXK32823.1 lipase [Streptomyces armeniacus]